MITIRSPLKKTLLLLTLTTLTIGLTSAGSFNSPEDTIQDSDVLLAADEFSDSSNIEYVELEYEDPNGDSSVVDNMSDSDDTGNWTYNFDKDEDADGTQGDYNFDATAYDVDNNELDSTDTLTVTLDASGPDVEISDENNFVQDNPEFVFDVSDEYSDIEDVSASADSSDENVEIDDVNDDCSGESSCEADVEVDTSDLSDGDEFTVDLEATDEAGNTGDNGGNSFTLDGSYDGDSSASVEWEESGSNVLTGFANEDQDLLIDFEGDSVSETTAKCVVNGDEVDSDTRDASDEETEFVCGFDSIRFASSSFDVSIEVEDEAGNTETLVDDKQMIWDTESPSIDTLSQPNDISTFNDDFNLSVVASDDASGIQNLEYYFDPNTELGDGNSISLDSSGDTAVEKEFTVLPGDMSQGNHTVHVRAEDGNELSDIESFDFEYYPDREPDVNLNSPETIEIVSGEAESFSLDIENDAPFFLDRVEVSSSNSLWNGTKTASNLEKSEGVEKELTIDASDLEIGTYDLSLETAKYDSTQNIEIVVRANEEQQKDIEEDLDKWVSERSKLEENISSIDTLEPSNSDITDFTDKIDNANEAIENGDYYQARSYLQNIDSSFSQASETFTEKQEEHNKNERNRLLMIIFGSLVLVGGAAAGFAARKEDLEIDELNIEEINGIGKIRERLPDDFSTPIDLPETEIVDSVKELLDRDNEEDDENDAGYSFKDFN